MPDRVQDRGEFVVTKEHRRFAELCDAVRRERYIGVCYGPPGVGKTQSARRYANWATLEPNLRQSTLTNPVTDDVDITARTILYTPKVHNTPRIVDNDVRTFHDRLGWLIGFEDPEADSTLAKIASSSRRRVELLIVDEADRLKTPSLEQLRDHHDRTGIGLILIGMPGIERRSRALPAAVLAHRLRARVPRAEHRRADVRPPAPLGRNRPDALSRGFHRCRSDRRRRADHQRQLPPRPTPLRPDHPHPGDQQPHHDQPRSRRNRPRSPDHRQRVAYWRRCVRASRP